MTSLRFTVADRALLDEALAQLDAYFATIYGDGILNITDPRAFASAVGDASRRAVKVILFLAVSALLITALNLSNIFSSRALRRRRSAGILKAMGAARTRVFAVFLLDVLVVGAIGSAAGVGLAASLARLLEWGVRPWGVRPLGVRSVPDHGRRGGIMDHCRRLQRAAGRRGGPSAGGRSDPLRVARRGTPNADATVGADQPGAVPGQVVGDAGDGRAGGGRVDLRALDQHGGRTPDHRTAGKR